MKNSLLEKENMKTESSDYEEWINSFSGLNGRDSIGKKEIPIGTMKLSDFVQIKTGPIGV